MQNTSQFIDELNKDNRSLVYRCRWSTEDLNNVVPKLIGALTDDNHLIVDDSLRALFTIGTPAVMAAKEVTKLINSPYLITKQLAVQTLGQIAHQKPELCMSAIIEALEIDVCRDDALRILGFLGSKAKSALPTVLTFYESKVANTRKLVITAATSIDFDSKLVQETLKRARTDKNKIVRDKVNKLITHSVA